MARKGRESRGEDTNPAFVKPKAWPVTVRYQRSPVYLPSSLASQSFPTRGLVRHPLPESSARSVVRIKAIDQPDHPAHGQYGLVATKDLKPGTLVLTYCGRVTRQDQVSPTSNYSLSFGPDLAIDAEKEGNEGRYINDYRGIALRPNVGFQDFTPRISGATVLTCEVRMGIWVLGKKISKGQELLLSYGKGFWRARQAENSVEEGIST